MKNFIQLTGIIIIVLNTIISLLFNSSKINIIFSDISLVFTTLAIYYIFKVKMNDGFKIGFTVFYLLTGLTRYIITFLSPETLKNNIFLSVFLILLSLEIIFFYLAKYVSKNI